LLQIVLALGALTLASHVPASASHQIIRSLVPAPVAYEKLLEGREVPFPKSVAIGDYAPVDQFDFAQDNPDVNGLVEWGLAVIIVHDRLAGADHSARLAEILVHLFEDFRIVRIDQRAGYSRPYANVIGWGLPAIPNFQMQYGWTIAPKSGDGVILGSHIGAQLPIGGVFGNLVSDASPFQHLLGLHDRENDASDTYTPNDELYERETQKLFSPFGHLPLGGQIILIAIIGPLGLYGVCNAFFNRNNGFGVAILNLIGGISALYLAVAACLALGPS